MAANRPLGRDDLEIAPRVIGGDVVYFVGDPLRGEFQQLDELQYAVFTKLDGDKTLADIAMELGQEYDAEVEPEEIAEFVDNLESLNLIDVTTTEALTGSVSRRVAKQVLAHIESSGVRFSLRSASVERRQEFRGPERRHRQDEAAHIDQALIALRGGDARRAASHLRACLRLRPSNARARYLLRIITAKHVGKSTRDQDLWFFRVPLANPDRTLTRLHRAVGWLFFHRFFIPTYLLLFAAACFSFFVNLDALGRDVGKFLEFKWLAVYPFLPFWLWFVNKVIFTMVHEVCHGLTCKNFGVRVTEMGFLVAYLQPTAYCDISSTYLLENRWQRAAASGAGVFFEGALFILFALSYPFLPADSAIGLFVVIALPVSLFGFIMEFNPVLKSDAYLALSDILNAPNLREDSFKYIVLRLKSFFTGLDIPIPEDLEANKRKLLSYAVPACVGTALTLGSGFIIASSFIISKLHGLGLLLSLASFYLLVGRFIRRGLKVLWVKRRELWALPRPRYFAIAAVVAFIGLLAMPLPLVVDVECYFVPHTHAVRAPHGGLLEEVMVRDGAQVNAGDPMFRLDTTSERAELVQRQTELDRAELALLELMEGARAEELDVKRAELSTSTRMLAVAGAELAKIRRRYAQGLSSSNELDAAKRVEAAARSRRGAAWADLEALAAGARQQEITAATARLKGLRSQRDDTQRRIEEATMRAPSAGKVTMAQRPDELINTLVVTGQPLARVRGQGTPTLEAMLPPAEPVALLHPGASAEARLKGMPGFPLRGEVSRLRSLTRATEEQNTVYVVEVDILDDTNLTATFVEVTLDNVDGAAEIPAGLSGYLSVRGDTYPVIVHLYQRVQRLIEIDLARLL